MHAPLVSRKPCIVARGQEVGPGFHGEIQKRLEFDLRVAEDVRIGGAARGIFRKEVGEDPLLILLREVDRIVGDVQRFADPAHVLEVLLRRAGAVQVLPVAHEDAGHLIALLLQEQSRHGAVHAAGQAHDHAAVVPRLVHIKRPSCAIREVYHRKALKSILPRETAIP